MMEGRLKVLTKVREESAINFDRIEEKRLQIPNVADLRTFAIDRRRKASSMTVAVAAVSIACSNKKALLQLLLFAEPAARG
jgi:hypothetical protein